MSPVLLAAAVIAAYLVGSFPSARLAGRAHGVPDVRDHGSGNVGASNALRVLGPASAFVVVLLDIAKGWLAARYISRWIPGGTLDDPQWSFWITGFAAVLGHVWPIQSRFRGGKGVATTAGVWLAASPLVFVAAIATFALVARLSRRASVASLTAVLGLVVAAAAGVLDGWVHDPEKATLFAAASALLILFTHRSNLRNLFAGREARF